MFDSAQRLFFWWFSAVVIRGDTIRKAVRNSSGSNNKPELVDVLALITRLLNEGKLSERQLDVLAKYGRRRREPRAFVWTERRESELWGTTMATLDLAFKKLGWVA